jgi:hypothetical protein
LREYHVRIAVTFAFLTEEDIMTINRLVQFVLFAVLLLLAACQQTPTPQAPEEPTPEEITLTAQAVSTPGRVVGWGDNSKGQLNVPAGLNSVTAIAAGCNHSLALKSDGTVVAWGDNSKGQLKIPTGLNNVTAIAAGCNHSLALKSTGTVVAWGANDYGQLNVPWFAEINVTAIAAGGAHSLTLNSDGRIVGWGANNFGQIDISWEDRYKTAIAAGDGYSVALQSDGSVRTWGDNSYLQQNGPYALYKYTAIAAGAAHGLALTSDGRVTTWGYNIINPDGSGELSVPAGLYNVKAIAAGGEHSLALKSDGTVVNWGVNEPTVPAGLKGVMAIAAGYHHSLALIPNISVTINQDAGQADPTRYSDARFVATFSEPVTGFTAADVILGGTADRSRATISVSGGPSTYQVSVAGVVANGTLTASIAANAVTDAAGNGNTPSTSTDNTVTLDRIRPNVTLNQAAGQADPSSASSINFTAVFSEAVPPFDPRAVTVSGTAGATTATVSEVAPNDGTTFNVAVSGMRGSGTVTVIIDSGRVSDKAGNPNFPSTSTDNTVTYTVDSTPPVITPTVTGTLGTNEWHTSDVSVSWSVVDNESAISNQTGCDTTSVTTDTPGIRLLVTCAATSIGGSASQSVIIKRDATAPTVRVTGVDNGGSYSSAPSAGCQTIDETSGVASEATPTITDNSGGSFMATCTNTDNAGNSGSASVTYTVVLPDTTPPTAAPSITDTSSNPISASATGWYRKQVTVTWNWSDDASGSGIDNANCTASTSSSGQGELTLTASCYDVANNQGSASLVVKVDTVAPSISYAGASPASPNAQGWYKTNVVVNFTGTDATSGIASCPTKMVSEGFGKTARGVCTDNAGNQKFLLSPAFNIDKTKPVVNVLMNGSVVSGTTPSYSLAQGIPTASCETTDALSGVAVPASLSLVKVTSSGEVAAANPPTTTGTYRAKCLGALDNADNANARTVTFKITR